MLEDSATSICVLLLDPPLEHAALELRPAGQQWRRVSGGGSGTGCSTRWPPSVAPSGKCAPFSNVPSKTPLRIATAERRQTPRRRPEGRRPLGATGRLNGTETATAGEWIQPRLKTSGGVSSWASWWHRVDMSPWRAESIQPSATNRLMKAASMETQPEDPTAKRGADRRIDDRESLSIWAGREVEGDIRVLGGAASTGFVACLILWWVVERHRRGGRLPRPSSRRRSHRALAPVPTLAIGVLAMRSLLEPDALEPQPSALQSLRRQGAVMGRRGDAPSSRHPIPRPLGTGQERGPCDGAMIEQRTWAEMPVRQVSEVFVSPLHHQRLS
jgi:hypothetical protein